MGIHEIIKRFETELKNIGFNDIDSAMLLQPTIDGNSYIHSIGDLNNLSKTSGEHTNQIKCDYINFMSVEIENANIQESTKKNHLDTLRILKSYQASIEISSINSDYLLFLAKYMRDNCNLSTNTIAKHMKIIKKYLNEAKKKDLVIKDAFANYKIHTEKTYREFLTEKELLKLEEYKIQVEPNNEVLNAFLFACYTGLRYSDVRTVTKQDINNINKKRWLIKKMKKTNFEVRVPLSTIFNGKALELIRHIHRTRGTIFKITSTQQVNRELSRITKIIGIKKNITFHCARHTCATLLIYRNVPITTVQKILGHKNITTTQIYSAVTDLTIENDIKRSNKIK